MAKNLGPLVVIVGETASGKSALALEIAKRFDGEILCADSLTVYKGFNIGTAKPSKVERALIPHHLLDIADPRGGFSAAVFKKLALSVIDSIHAKSKLPVLVGGTGLYIDSVIYDYEFLPAPQEGVRSKLNSMSLEELLKVAQAEGLLNLNDPVVDIRNKRRVIRLIENEGRLPARQPLRPNTLLIGLEVGSETLRIGIEKRIDEMLKLGLEFEAKALAECYGWGAEPMKSIGYKEWHDYFEGQQSYEQTRGRIISSTLQLAKKQRTWFRRNKSIHWVKSQRQAVDLTTTFLNKNLP